MRARDFFLALLVIGLGVFLSYAKSGRLDDLTFGWDGPWARSLDDFTFEETREIPGPLPAEIQVINSHGTIEVAATGTAEKATVHFKERIAARNRTEAEAVAEALRMDIASSGGRLVLSTNRDDFRRRNFRTEFKMTVPPGTVVRLKNSYGPVRVEGTGKAEIDNPHGEVFVRRTSGLLKISSSYASIVVDGVAGNVRLSAPHAEVDLRNIDGEVDVEHSYGRIALDGIARRSVIKGTHSEVEASNLSDQADISSSYKRITVASTRSLVFRAHHCDISAKAVDGSFEANDSYGHVRIEGLTGDLKIDGTNVRVTGLGLGAGSLFVKTTYENVALSGFSGPAEVVLSHAGLVLEPAPTLSGKIGVQGEYADVRLVWPDGFQTPFEARTRNGRIVWNLARKPDSETSNGSTEIRAFTSETGKPKIEIATVHGDIRVEAAGRGDR